MGEVVQEGIEIDFETRVKDAIYQYAEKKVTDIQAAKKDAKKKNKIACQA